MFGYTAQAVIGRTITSLIVPEEFQAEEVDISTRITCGETVPHFQTRRQRSDGRMLDVSVTVSPICSADGAIVGAAKTIRDISEQKATEVAIAELNAMLEKHS
jgi:PAS domain S-box-containing protein